MNIVSKFQKWRNSRRKSNSLLGLSSHELNDFGFSRQSNGSVSRFVR